MKSLFKQNGSDPTDKLPLKRKIISSVLAIAAASSMLTGCNIFSPPGNGSSTYSESEYSWSYSYEYSSEYSSAESEYTSFEETVSQNPESSSSSSTYSAPYSTSSSAAQPSDAPEDIYRPRFLDTKSEEFVEYTGSTLTFADSGYTPYLFDFRTHMAVGYSLHDTKNQLAVEADYGVMGMFDGSIISVRTYDYTGNSLSVVSSYIESLDAYDGSRVSAPFGPVTMTNDCCNLHNGLYRITVTYSNYTTAHLYYLINGDEFSFCQMIQANETTGDCNSNINDIRDRRAVLKKLLAESTVTPENSLSVDIIKYPYIDKVGLNGELYWRCDTDLWADLSDSLVRPEWSTERKAYVICDWISQNFAYDSYVSDVLHKDRAHHHNDFTGTYSTWKLRSGVCRDFGQIVAIMLRQQGIPTEVIANDDHLWNIVYINGRWIETDLCYSATKYVDGEDTTVRTDSHRDYFGLLSMAGQNNNRHYGTSLHRYLYMGQTEF